MTRPSDWLATAVVATEFYPEGKLAELLPYGIAHDGGGILCCRIEVGHPYSPFGRLSTVPFLTERAIIAEARRMGFPRPVFELHGLDMAFGFEIVASVWRLVRPITVEIPPSTYHPDPDVKARVDLAAIRGYGY